MSQFIGAGAGAGMDVVVYPEDAYNQMRPQFWGGSDWLAVGLMPKDITGSYSYATPFWPGNMNLYTDAGGTDGDLIDAQGWGNYDCACSGHIFRYGIVGVTRDQYGSPLAGVTVKLFRTLDDSIQDTQTSASDGSYILGTPYIDAHYVVSQKSGPPPVAGATVNTLIATT